MPRGDLTVQVELLQDSCFNKGLLGGVVGYLMGGVFGLILGAMPGNQVESFQESQKAERLKGFNKKLRFYFNDTMNRATTMSKTFGRFSIVYGASECVIEKARGKHDLLNAVAGGCVTGATLGARSGPVASGVGCVGIAAFSGAIDFYMEGLEWSDLDHLSP